ncbi:hypothetical protein PFISCL1PPCAC_1407, partial [Pristionchus fissidentatus]
EIQPNMDDKAIFLNWLVNYQAAPGFINTSWCARLITNIPKICTAQDKFQIPFFVIAEELRKEETGKGCESPKIREFLMHLLRLLLPYEISPSNSNEELRKILDNLPSGLNNPLSPGASFHALPSNIKLWIFNILQKNSKRDLVEPASLGRDSTGNEYFLVHGGHLYVRLGKDLENMKKEDEYRGEEQWASVERHLRATAQWKLVAKSSSKFQTISLIMKGLGEAEIAGIIEGSVEEARNTEHTEEEKESERRAFEQRFVQLQLDAAPRKSILKKTNIQPSYNVADSTDSAPSSPASPSPSEPRSTNQPPPYSMKERPKTASVKCMYDPHCKPRNGEACNFLHPTIECSNFGTPKCPGVYCRYLHPICPRDERKCDDNDCAYQHVKSAPTLLRRNWARINAERASKSTNGGNAQSQRAERGRSATRNGREEREPSRDERSTNEKEKNRERSISRVRFADEEKEEENKQEERPSFTSDNTQSRNMLSPPNNSVPARKKDLRCPLFPDCLLSHQECEYTHPKLPCRFFTLGQCRKQRDCTYLHGPCKRDGSCDDEMCPKEHYNQKAPRVEAILRMRYAGK